MYGYIDCLGQFVCPDVVEYKGEALHNPSETVLAELGYLLQVTTEAPADTGYEAYYVERDGQAVQCWRVAASAEPTAEDRIAELESLLDLLLGVNDDE